MIMDNAIYIELQRSYRKGELEVTVRLIAAGKVVAGGGGDRWWWMGWW